MEALILTCPAYRTFIDAWVTNKKIKQQQQKHAQFWKLARLQKLAKGPEHTRYRLAGSRTSKYTTIDNNFRVEINRRNIFLAI